MSNKIVLISDDRDFFEFIITKLELRKTDELFTFSFKEILNKIHLLTTALIIINSENTREKTLDLLKILKHNPVVVCAYNNDDELYRKKCYKAGAIDLISILISDSEFRARMIPIFSIASLLEKNNSYRDILVKKELLSSTNEVFINYEEIIDYNLKKIKDSRKKAVFAAISPNEKTKFILNSNQIETILLNNIRLNDVLINYAPNKYFLILFDSDIISAEKLWMKIISQLPEKLYIGLVNITNQSRQQIINEALNKLHLAINNDKGISDYRNSGVKTISSKEVSEPYSNFKLFKKDFEKKIELILTPVFYQIQQKYVNKLAGVELRHKIQDGCGKFTINTHNSTCSFVVTSPGFSKINIDITMQKNNDIDTKRITIDPEELESGILEDLLEQFIQEYKSNIYNL